MIKHRKQVANVLVSAALVLASSMALAGPSTLGGGGLGPQSAQASTLKK